MYDPTCSHLKRTRVFVHTYLANDHSAFNTQDMSNHAGSCREIQELPQPDPPRGVIQPCGDYLAALTSFDTPLSKPLVSYAVTAK
jgi:hypothetical protein